MERVLIIAAGLVLGLALMFSFVLDASLTPSEFLTQDRYVAVVLVAALLASCRLPGIGRLPGCPPGWLPAIAVALGLALLLWLGTYRLMLDYPWTIDEVMARFDARILTSGCLAQPVPPQWRPFVPGLSPYFLLDVPGHAAMVSSYMPVHAALRALIGLVADPALLNPLLAAGGFLLALHLAREEFADCAGAVWVVGAGYLLSTQIMAAAMSSYAMTGHLALNLAWLACFRRQRWGSDLAALAIGFLATGLHQIAFHPLFAAPFLAEVLWHRQWRRVLTFATGYMAILAFWVSYPHLVLLSQGLGAGAMGEGGGAAGFWSGRIAPLLFNRDPHTLALMDKNLLRFLCWNAGFMLPLMLLSWPAIRRGEGMARPMAAGLALTIGLVAVVMPDQGHGWGYRYVHGVLGNALFLAGHGYRLAARRDAVRADRMVIWPGLATLLLVMPFLLGAAHGFLVPAARLTALIEAQRADVVILDTMRPSMAIKQVRNLPDLTNRPLVISSYHLQPGQAEELCRRGSVVLIDRAAQQAVGFSPWLPRKSPEFEALVKPLAARSCLRHPVPLRGVGG
ncbi:MAG: hypothetical protein KGJ57_09205 [Sphingomonadales bacterium]|nr:hypothetical protein [Sphingomonadales bacterium]MDE2169587.1 hypothetical protein [Sphingomonadales bacterium]